MPCAFCGSLRFQPLASTFPLWILARPHKPRSFIQPEHDVHVLDRTSRLAFHEVVNEAHHDELPCPLIEVQGDVAEVAAPHIGAREHPFRPEDPDKGVLL